MTSRNIWRTLKAIVMMCLTFIIFASCWTAVYFLSPYLYTFLAWELSPYFTALINMLLGSILCIVLVRLFFFFFVSNRFEVGESLTNAMRRIAKGDFKVQFDVDHRYRGPFQEIFHEMNHMALELHEMEQMRQEFISDVSHEIQSPLTSISGFARALRNKEIPEEQRLEYLRIIEDESIRLSKLSDNLLKLASLESDKHPYEPKRYRLDRQIGALLLTCEPQWLSKSIEMNVDLEEAYVTADEALMSQVWINLFSNSIKFTPEGGKIDVNLRVQGQMVDFIIRDTGIGIELESQELIFQRFYKADKSRNRQVGGSGLGLSLVKKIIEMNEGKITLQSELGKGSEFTVSLPRAASIR
ncbi:MAG: sensor histidine kinase [Candidatus Pristimantibacillus sp.]